MSSVPALQIPVVTIRTATPADHDALQALEGAAPDAGANLIQARRNFFARMAAYDRTRVLVAEQNHLVVGVLCLALTPVRVAGRPCSAGYMFNIRVAPGQQTRGVGTRLMNAGAEWLEGEGCRYATGLIGVSNDASMRMVGALGWEAVGRFDYLILDLARFEADPAVRIRKVDALGDPAHAAWRFGEVSLHHFVPRYLVSELFRPYPRGPYMGSLTAFGPGGSAWVSLWDDRVRRGLDPDRVIAESSSILWTLDVRGRDRAGHAFKEFVATGGGMGARPNKDGLNATQFPSTIRGVPAEIVESTSPLVIHRRALAPDSGGDGRWRGGLGMIVEFGVETDEDWLFTASFERARIPCQGLLGGGPGAPGRVETADGRALDAKAQHWLRPGDRVVLHTPGGGGYGDQRERDPALIAEDIAAGRVTRPA